MSVLECQDLAFQPMLPSTISLPVPISMPSLNACEQKEIGNTFNTNLLRSCTDTDSVSIQTATPNHNQTLQKYDSGQEIKVAQCKVPQTSKYKASSPSFKAKGAAFLKSLYFRVLSILAFQTKDYLGNQQQGACYED